MKHAFLMVCLLALAACATPVVNAKKAVTANGNRLNVASGTLGSGQFARAGSIICRQKGTRWNSDKGVNNVPKGIDARDLVGEELHQHQQAASADHHGVCQQ